ncbi:unnamed protein product, partial [Meganyctiphanes norvegica]
MVCWTFVCTRMSLVSKTSSWSSLVPMVYGGQPGSMMLLALLVVIHKAHGQYDRGGPQHDITWGRGNSPHSAVFGPTETNITAVLGHQARLPCQVMNLGLKDVSWIRQRDLHILTVGRLTYTTDDRFKVYHPPETEDWYLDISSVTFRDDGIYECQVSTSPKVSLPVALKVLGEQEAVIPGPHEVYIQVGSTISLQCDVTAGSKAIGPVRWYLGGRTLNYTQERGGISMEVEKTPTYTTSKLYVTRATRKDSGNYTCKPKFAKSDSVTVHVVPED